MSSGAAAVALLEKKPEMRTAMYVCGAPRRLIEGYLFATHYWVHLQKL